MKKRGKGSRRLVCAVDGERAVGRRFGHLLCRTCMLGVSLDRAKLEAAVEEWQRISGAPTGAEVRS